jgi:4,5-dihydroxyphthalate decarboxylase
VVKSELLDEMPELAQRLTAAFARAKDSYMKRLDGDDSPAAQAARALGAVLGDPFPFGVAANRKALEAIVQFAVEQRVIPRAFKTEELFAPT